LLSDQDLAEWQAAIDEYEAKHGDTGEQVKYPIGTVAFYGPDDKTTTMILLLLITGDSR
jgi:hypothetical protein